MNLMTPAAGAVAVDQESIVLAGFRDCTEEAIRYLMEVEHLPEDDPLVLGLRQHLLAKQQQLDVERILHSSLPPMTAASDSSSTGSSGCADSIILTSGDQLHHAHDSTHSPVAGGGGGEPLNSLSPVPHLTDSASSRSETPMSDTPMDGVRSDSELQAPDSEMISFPAAPLQQQQQQQQPQQQQLPEGVAGSQHDAQNAASVLNLALLAQSNPAIASLTEEILSLLEGDADHESEEEADSAFLDESIE